MFSHHICRRQDISLLPWSLHCSFLYGEGSANVCLRWWGKTISRWKFYVIIRIVMRQTCLFCSSHPTSTLEGRRKLWLLGVLSFEGYLPSWSSGRLYWESFLSFFENCFKRQNKHLQTILELFIHDCSVLFSVKDSWFCTIRFSLKTTQYICSFTDITYMSFSTILWLKYGFKKIFLKAWKWEKALENMLGRRGWNKMWRGWIWV